MRCRFRAVLALAAAFLWSADTSVRSEIPQKTIERKYPVRGKTAAEVAAYMRDRPFPGDNGPAIANIRARYSFDFKTKTDEASCRADRFRLRVEFTMTLPHATQESSFDRKTKRSWQSLQQFVRRHEGVHRNIYLSCARQMEREVKKLRPKACRSLDREIGRIVREMKQACEAKQRAFDRRELRRLTNHGFFKQARAERDRNRRKLTAGVRRGDRGQLLFHFSE